MLAEGMGVDLTNDGKISVTLQALNVGMSNASETPQGNMTVNTDADGDTVSSALSSLGKKASKRIFFGQNKIIILGRELAESDMEKYIDFFIRSDDVRGDIALCLSEGEAKSILESKENDASVPCENILNLITDNEKTAHSIFVSAADFTNMYYDKTSDICLPVVEKAKGESTVKASGIALFSGSSLSCIITGDEAKGFVILQNKAQDVSLEITDEELGKIDIKLSGIKCRKTAAVQNGSVVFNAEIDASIILDEIENGSYQKLSASDYKRISFLSSRKIEEICSNAFASCKRAESDSLRVGEYLAMSSPEAYSLLCDSWKSIFTAALFEVSAEARLAKISDNSQLE